MGPETKEQTLLIIQRRMAGEDYKSIAASLGIRIQAARMACLRAMWKGKVTPEQIHYSPNKPIASDAEYDAQWLARLASKSQPGPNGCIIVPNIFHNEDGYVISAHRKHGQFAHRVVVILGGREIPPGFMGCHRCGNHGCVNDDHLYVGTMKENARDTVAMGRHLEKQKTHCKQGHEFTPENTRLVGPRLNKRQCKACQRAAQRGRWHQYTPEQREYIRTQRRERKRVLRESHPS